jgi:hypothetical protein
MVERAAIRETEMAAPAKETESDPLTPLNDIDAIINQHWASSKEAAKRAAKPFHIKIGRLLLEAQSQMPDSEFGPWVERHFRFSLSQAQRHMRAVPAAESAQIRQRAPTLSETMDRVRTHRDGNPQTSPGTDAFAGTFKENVVAFDWAAYYRDQADKAKEQKLISDLVRDIGDAGFKVLAKKYHEDAGGDTISMQRLNEARRQANELLTPPRTARQRRRK